MTKTKGAYVGKRGRRGFVQTGGLLTRNIREASEARGFSETRLLTQWAEVAGEAIAKISRPVKVGYARNSIGATLTLLCSGANAPMVQMQVPQILKRVNACYGYKAIARITITQTAPSGFGEAERPAFERRKPNLPPEKSTALAKDVSDIESDKLREALQTLGENILAKGSQQRKGTFQ